MASMRDPFASYDRWLTQPYDEMADAPECPVCGSGMDEDRHEQSVECPECGYSAGRDWDAEAEARAEARAERWS